jgi:hypothetical protein
MQGWVVIGMLVACDSGDSREAPVPIPAGPIEKPAQPVQRAHPAQPAAAFGRAPTVSSGALGFDAAACAPGDGGSRSLGLGSQRIVVVGPDGDDCKFTNVREVEGGYRVEECRVARATGRVMIAKADTPGPVPGTCVVTKAGNGFDDMRTAPVTAQIQIPNSHYVLHSFTANSGRGAIVRKGEHVKLVLSLWGNPTPALTAKVMDTAAALVVKRPIAVVLGEATLGRSLDAALLDTSGGALCRGGERRVLIREEAAGELLAGLGVERSGIAAESQLLVQVTLPR